MAQTSPFTLPAGVEIDARGETLSIRHDGDVILEQTMGLRLGEVECGGDLILRLDRVTGHLRAGGKLVTTATVEAEILQATEVHLGNTSIKAHAIAASRRIVIGAADLTVDVIIAPEIVLDPNAHGRVKVIESHNDPGPSKIKGGFDLSEYEELFGDAIGLLTSLGLEPLGKPSSVPTPPPEPAYEPPEPEPTLDEVPPPTPVEEEEDIDDPLSLSIDDLEPVVEEPQDTFQPRLEDALKRIVSCYDDGELPPAVHELESLIRDRRYDDLRDGITEIWNGLLGFHQKRGIRPHHQVTHAFNMIHGLVQEG